MSDALTVEDKRLCLDLIIRSSMIEEVRKLLLQDSAEGTRYAEPIAEAARLLDEALRLLMFAAWIDLRKEPS